MQKLSKLLLTFIAGVLVALVGISIGTKPQEINNIPPQEEIVATSSTSLKANSTIFKEERGQGLVSFLEIKIPEAPSSVKSIKIIQTIGSTSRVLTEDETGNTCYYQNSSLQNKNTTFYFTRPATYTVIYIYGANNTRIQESCTFKPELNNEIIKNLATIQNAGGSKPTSTKIIEADSKYFLTVAGNITLPIDDKGLYSISAKTSSTSVPDLLTNIPDNSFGTVTYTITSTNGNCYLTLDIIVLTARLSVEFEDLNEQAIEKSNHSYLGGYVFNEGVTAIITVDGSAKSLTGTTLTNSEKLTALNLLDFSIIEEKRDNTNTSVSETIETNLTAPNSSPVLNVILEEQDHSIYTIKTTILNSVSSTEYSNGLPKFKVITKVPVKSNGKTVFSIIPTQGDNKEEANYISGILNNYIKKDTIIYYPIQGIRVFYNKDEFGSSNISYKFNSSTGTITNSVDFLRMNSINGIANLQISSKTEDFNQFYTFSFITKSYASDGTAFHSTMLSGQMKYSTNLEQSHFYDVNDDYSDSFNNLTTPITAFKYVIPANYETNCIPTYMRVTYNGTTYDNIHQFINGDEILLTSRGDYSIEFYNLPSFDYIEKNIPNWNANGDTASINFYYKLNFTITGPAIKVSTTGADGKSLTVSNNMYTQSPVTCNVSLNAGQKFIVYQNGNEYTTRTSSMNFSLSTPSTWKISIVTNEGTELTSLTFTIVDTIYQGFTINEQPEYLNLKVSKRTSSLPITYTELDYATAYHLTQSGTYKIEIDALESLPFILRNSVNDPLGSTLYTHTINSNSFEINITKSFFSFAFATGSNGDRITDDIAISSVDGVQLQKLEVYRNNKLVK